METFKQSWRDESEDMEKRLETEVKLRNAAENSRKELKIDIEEARKFVRAAEDSQHELRVTFNKVIKYKL